MDDTSPGSIVLLAIVFEGGLGLVAVAVGWSLGHDLLAHVHWTWQAVLWGVGGTLPPAVVLYWRAQTAGSVCHALAQLVRQMLRPYFAGSTWGDLALVSLAAGMGEELLFRGLLQELLAIWVCPWIGLLLVSLLFGMAHFISRAYAVLAALMGAYLGGLSLVCDNLLVPIVAHALYDFLALMYLLRTDQPTGEELREQEGAPM
jgi:membrane protease YdiL (CAAX protease family)